MSGPETIVYGPDDETDLHVLLLCHVLKIKMTQEPAKFKSRLPMSDL